MKILFVFGYLVTVLTVVAIVLVAIVEVLRWVLTRERGGWPRRFLIAFLLWVIYRSIVG